MKFKFFFIIAVFSIFSFSVFAEESKIKKNNNELSIFTGIFDFSDEGKRANLIGVQHQNEDLNRDTFIFTQVFKLNTKLEV